MDKKTIATLFSGGGGVEVGAEAAGFTSLWGLEHRNDIAQVGRNNGLPVITADVTTARPTDYEQPYVLHASTSCKSFRPGRTETEQDIELGRATARFIETLRPPVFTLENVWLYRKSESWRIIVDALNRLGYWTQVSHCNAADFGVPQTRKRMIVRSALGHILPPLPAPVPWISSWYEAIEDLIPGLPDSSWAQWQIDRGVLELTETALVGAGGYNGTVVMSSADEPAFTVTTNSNQASQVKAFLVSGQTANDGNGLCIRADAPGRIVKLSARCLARLQSFPDSYILPDSKALAVTVIGNAVPPLLYQRIVEAT